MILIIIIIGFNNYLFTNLLFYLIPAIIIIIIAAIVTTRMIKSIIIIIWYLIIQNLIDYTTTNTSIILTKSFLMTMNFIFIIIERLIDIDVLMILLYLRTLILLSPLNYYSIYLIDYWSDPLIMSMNNRRAFHYVIYSRLWMETCMFF